MKNESQNWAETISPIDSAERVVPKKGMVCYILMLGCRVIRVQSLEKYADSANFGNFIKFWYWISPKLLNETYQTIPFFKTNFYALSD